MGRSIGLQSSRMCQEEVRQFLDCQKTNSFGARVGGICNGLRVILDECLDNEVIGPSYDFSTVHLYVVRGEEKEEC